MIFISPEHPDLPNETSADTVQLALKWKGKLDNAVLDRLLRQVNGKLKTKDKLPLWNKSDVAFPAGLSLEQCSSEQTALYKTRLIKGERAADLTGGLGVDAWALATVFNELMYVERDEELCVHAEYNFKKLKAGNIQVQCEEAETFLNKMDHVDLIFLDPARRANSKKVFQIQDCEPRLDLLWEKLHEQADSVLVKLSPLLDLKNLHHQLIGNYEIHVVSVENECKEILLLSSRNSQAGKIHIALLGKQDQYFEFNQKEESELTVSYSDPKGYLYEPDVAILKAGAFKHICKWFNVHKAAPNSHLYFSDVLIKDFPGRKFKITSVHDFNPKKIKRENPWPKANITVRNFPAEVADIRKQTGIKDGGAVYLFATTLLNGSLMLIETERT
jgi:hypothetical protein